MKVALSASCLESPAVVRMLRGCDVVYTTQHRNLEKIRDILPGVEVLPIPDQRPDLIEFLKERHKEDEVVTFSDILNASRL